MADTVRKARVLHQMIAASIAKPKTQGNGAVEGSVRIFRHGLVGSLPSVIRVLVWISTLTSLADWDYSSHPQFLWITLWISL
jgi:hypothetical protein